MKLEHHHFSGRRWVVLRSGLSHVRPVAAWVHEQQKERHGENRKVRYKLRRETALWRKSSGQHSQGGSGGLGDPATEILSLVLFQVRRRGIVDHIGRDGANGANTASRENILLGLGGTAAWEHGTAGGLKRGVTVTFDYCLALNKTFRKDTRQQGWVRFRSVGIGISGCFSWLRARNQVYHRRHGIQVTYMTR